MSAAAEIAFDTSASSSSPKASILAQAAPSVASSTSCAAVHEMLRDNEALSAVAVVEGDQPVGLVSRLEFLANMARPYWPELFNRKPIARLMDPQPLIVEGSHDIERVSSLLLSSKPKAMVDGFIVTTGGRYSGIATATDLMRMTTNLAGERLNHLSKALHQVTEANGAKATFLANVSHELRTPLNAIIGFSDLLGRKLYGNLTKQQDEHVGYIHHSGQLLLSLVEDLLSLSVVEAGKMELHEEPVDLQALLVHCSKLSEPRADGAGVELRCYPGPDPQMIQADEVKLKQVLLNLLTNAIKFTPQGGEVGIALSNLKNGDFRILVSDTGIGIAENEIGLIMQPFGQSHDKRAHRNQGAGLGLPLSKALLELHGGHLSLTSRPNVGTEVEVLLPAKRRLSRQQESLPRTA